MVRVQAALDIEGHASEKVLFYAYLNAGALGFAPMPAPMLAVLVVIVALYVVAAEVAKGVFYRSRRS